MGWLSKWDSFFSCLKFQHLCILYPLKIISMLLILAFQYIQEKHQQEEILRNLTQKYHVMQNENYLNEQLLTNKTLEYSILYNQRKGCCRKMDVFSKPLQNTGMEEILKEKSHSFPSLLPLPKTLRLNKQAYVLCQWSRSARQLLTCAS